MKTRSYLRNFALFAGAALLSAGAMAAPMDDSIVTRSETIKYSVPEAHTAAGAAVLYRKLNDAAESVCRTPDDTALFFYSTESYATCYTKALRKAVRKVNIAGVTALYFENQASGGFASNLKQVTEEPEVVASR